MLCVSTARSTSLPLPFLTLRLFYIGSFFFSSNYVDASPLPLFVRSAFAYMHTFIHLVELLLLLLLLLLRG